MLPRAAWPTRFTFAATPGMDPVQVEDAVRAATDELASRLAGTTRRSEIRAAVVDADECAAVLADLGVDPGAHTELRAFCAEHPGGRLIVAGADFEPNTRRTTIFG